MRILKRIINLLFFPAKEWKTIAAEINSRKTVYVQFVVPVLCIMALASIAGMVLYSLHGINYAICRILTLWSSISAGLYISAFLITELTVPELETREHKRDFVLMAYSSGAAYIVIIIVSLFPNFSEFLVLALYSCYLYWTGIPYIIKVEGQKRMTYVMLSFITIALVYFLMFFLFENIFKAIFL